ncbi:MAG: DMT family transporter, partial [Acidobacteriota bacterium]
MPVAAPTLFALVAFAANSLLCRMALGGESIDPVSFTTLRLLSGAIMLVVVSRLVGEPRPAPEKIGSWGSCLALFGYALAFSLAYGSLDTGTGALILFGTVQATMIGVGLKSGERPHPIQWVGLVVALGGLLYLVSPGLSAPDPLGAFLMLIAGIAWGVYSLRGRGVTTPVWATTGNFVRTVPLAVVASLLGVSWIHLEGSGMVLAVASGALTSGLGYVLWYRALRGLSTTRAAIAQLFVPVLAAFGGVVFLSEQVTLRLVVASILILAGVATGLGTASWSRGPRGRSADPL